MEQVYAVGVPLLSVAVCMPQSQGALSTHSSAGQTSEAQLGSRFALNAKFIRSKLLLHRNMDLGTPTVA
jgi:hypothetical protein